MKISIVLSAFTILIAKTYAQWGGFGGGGFGGGGFGGGGAGGGKSINDYKKEQVAGRDIHVYAPSNLAPNSPLLLSLHGMDQDPNYQQSNTHWETLADKEGFVVVYPRGGTGMSTWDIQGDKDTKWVVQIIDQMAKEYNIDTKRVYLSGFSMGGMFTYHAMSKIADKIAAFAPQSGPNVYGASKAQRPVPIFHVHGTNDNVLNYQQVEGFLKNYRDQFKCPAQADTKTNYPNSENPNATLYSWGPCDGGVYIKHLKLQGRGHSPSQADIGDIWNFVKEYTLDGPVSSSNATSSESNQSSQPTQTSKPAQTTQQPTQTSKPAQTTQPSNNAPTEQKTCVGAQGFPCCTSPDYIVYYMDEDGRWSVENGDWCLVKN